MVRKFSATFFKNNAAKHGERERKNISCRFLFIDIFLYIKLFYMVRKDCTFIVMCLNLYIFILQIHSFFGKCKFKPLKNLYIWQIYILQKKIYSIYKLNFSFFKQMTYIPILYIYNLLFLCTSLCFSNNIMCFLYTASLYIVPKNLSPNFLFLVTLLVLVIVKCKYYMNFMFSCCMFRVLFICKRIANCSWNF